MKINIPLTVIGSLAFLALSMKLMSSACRDIMDISNENDMMTYRKKQAANYIKIQENLIFDYIVKDL